MKKLKNFLKKKLSKEYILIAILLLIAGLLIGFAAGAYTITKAVASMTKGFLDEEMVIRAISQYKNNIGSCFPPKI